MPRTTDIQRRSIIMRMLREAAPGVVVQDLQLVREAQCTFDTVKAHVRALQEMGIEIRRVRGVGFHLANRRDAELIADVEDDDDEVVSGEPWRPGLSRDCDPLLDALRREHPEMCK